jgi:HD-GYP domain-containing protein (c-di-GMP phosphodiesterase class II)
LSTEGLRLADVAEAAGSISEDSGLTILRDLGKNLVNYLFMSCRTLAIHAGTNAATREPVRRLHDVLRDLSQHVQKTHLIAVEGQLYLNDLRIKMEAAAYGNATYVVDLLGKHGIGGLSFDVPPSEEDLRSLLMLLLQHRPPKGSTPEEALSSARAALEKADLPRIEFDRPYFYKAAGEGSDPSSQDVEASRGEQTALNYAKGVLAVKDYFRAVEAAEAANPLRIRKIVQDMVDVAEESPEEFLRLHTIHGIEDPYYNHCVNVASLSMAIGRELGLTRLELADLAACAMFHDLGYAAVEREAKQSGHEPTPDERMQAHPLAGFRTLLRQGEFGLGLLRRLLVALEHHMHFRRPGGYPSLGRKRLSVFTRIVQLADHYDALVTPANDMTPLLPVKALERIVASSGHAFDPLCVKVLVRVVGRYPYGSLVKLNTGEIGVVTSAGRTAETFLRPRVMVVRDEDGMECRAHEVDLTARGLPRRRVVAVLDPYEEGLTPHAVLWEGVGATPEEDDAPEEDQVDAKAPGGKDPAEDEGGVENVDREDALIKDLLAHMPDLDADAPPASHAEAARDPWAEALRTPSRESVRALPAAPPDDGPRVNATGPISTVTADPDEDEFDDDEERDGGMDSLIAILERMAKGGTESKPTPPSGTSDTERIEPVVHDLGADFAPDDGFLPSSDDLKAVSGDFDGPDVPELGTDVEDPPAAPRAAPPAQRPRTPVDPPPGAVTPIETQAVRGEAPTEGTRASTPAAPEGPGQVQPPNPDPAPSPATALPKPPSPAELQRRIAEAYRKGGEDAVQALMKQLGG